MGRTYPTLFAKATDDRIAVTGNTAGRAFVLDRNHRPITNEAPIDLHITVTCLCRLPWALLIAAAHYPGICITARRNDVAVANDGDAQGK